MAIISGFFFPKWFKFPWSINKRSWQYMCGNGFTFQVCGCSSVAGRWADYLKECLKWTLLRLSFSGSWEAMWENSLKMSRYVASPDGAREGKKERRACENDITQGPAARLKPGLSRSGFVCQKQSFDILWSLVEEMEWGGGVNRAEKTASLFQPRPGSKTVPLSGPMVIFGYDKSSWDPLCAMRAPRLN